MGVAGSPPSKVSMRDSIELPKGSFRGETTYQANYMDKHMGRPSAGERPHSRKDLIKNDNNFNGVSNYSASYVEKSPSKN